jgi:hypothetical protein
MALTRKKRYKNQTMRRSKIGPSTKAWQPSANPVLITSITHAGSTLLVVFTNPFVYSGQLPGWLNNGAHCTAVTVTSPTTATLTMSAATAATTTTIPYQDQAFRNMSAGYVNAGSYTTV